MFLTTISIDIQLTNHCYHERRARLQKMDRELGFGEIICTTIFRGTRQCLTSTGILLVMDATENILITAYPVKWRTAFKMFMLTTGNPPPQEYYYIVKQANYWDMKNHWN